MMNRRKFLKQSCSLCVAVAAAGSAGVLLSGCSAIPVISAKTENNKIAVPKTSFAEGEKLKLIRTNSLDFDILLVRKTADDYAALLMRCTHADNILIANSGGLSCNLHGSTFDLEGKVTLGPATQNLVRYTTRTDAQTIFIHTNELLKT